MKKSVEEIRSQMMAVRSEIDEDMDDLVEGAKSLFDWRDYIRSFPVASLGAAALAGFLVVPKKRHPIESDAASVAKYLKNERLVVAPGAKVNQGSMLTTLLAAVTAAGIKHAVSHFGGEASRAFVGTGRRPVSPADAASSQRSRGTVQ